MMHELANTNDRITTAIRNELKGLYLEKIIIKILNNNEILRYELPPELREVHVRCISKDGQDLAMRAHIELDSITNDEDAAVVMQSLLKPFKDMIPEADE